MKQILPALLLVSLACSGCNAPGKNAATAVDLAAARRGFQTKLEAQSNTKEAAEVAPAGIFSTVKYPAPGGKLAAYVSPNPKDGKKHPAIIWIVGGDVNSIGDVWTAPSRDNDQSAAAYRQAGIVMMFPSLRGGNDNPGAKEGFYGEVDDVIAAAQFLEKQDYVDPERIYLGGHSTGGTLALLVAESSARFRAVFSFGPTDDVAGYGADSGFLPFNISNAEEVKLRSPIHWLSSIQSPTWVFEGTQGNIDALKAMSAASRNPKVHFIEIEGASHFNVLAPTNALIARKIVNDTKTESNISFTQEEVNQKFSR